MARDEEKALAAERLREAIAKSGLSVNELARRLAGKGAPERTIDNWRSTIYKYLRGDSSPRAENARKLAKALGTEVDTLTHQPATFAELLGRFEELLNRLASHPLGLEEVVAVQSELLQRQTKLIREMERHLGDLVAQQAPARPARKRSQRPG